MFEEIITHSAEETQGFAQETAALLSGGELLLLEGSLGAGKTTFAQGLARGLGVLGPVRSPTFSIMNVHPAHHRFIHQMVHLDFYRFKKPEEALELGLEDWLNRPDTVVVAEWPKFAGIFLDASRTMHFLFERLDAQKHRITIS